jgi:hypothetical protein
LLEYHNEKIIFISLIWRHKAEEEGGWMDDSRENIFVTKSIIRNSKAPSKSIRKSSGFPKSIFPLSAL